MIFLTEPILGIIIPDMGIFTNALFTKTQQKVLALLFGQPDRAFYANEMISLAHSGAGAVQRELKRLSEAGLLNTWRVGNQKFYQANADSPIFAELHGIVVKTFGVMQVLQNALMPVLDAIDFAFIYGSMAKGNEQASSDVDVLVVGEVSHQSLLELLSTTREPLGRTVNPTLYTKSEWEQRLRDKKSFTIRIVEQPKIFIKGVEDDLAIN